MGQAMARHGTSSIIDLARGDTPLPRDRIVLDDVPWETYRAIADALPDQHRLFATYDHGRLELMTTSNTHEWLTTRLEHLIAVLAECLEIPMVAGGRQTFRSSDLARGFEPDLCYWIANEARMRVPPPMWDPTTCPPPDLVIEVEVSRRAIERMPLYAEYRIPEVWRTDGTSLSAHVLEATGEYREVPESDAVPGVAVRDLLPFLQPDPQLSSLAWVRSVRAWVQDKRPKS